MTHSLPAFTAPGRFWRGNLHTHSTRSDGVLEPGGGLPPLPGRGL